jgi:hypothetical protein
MNMMSNQAVFFYHGFTIPILFDANSRSLSTYFPPVNIRGNVVCNTFFMGPLYTFVMHDVADHKKEVIVSNTRNKKTVTFTMGVAGF